MAYKLEREKSLQKSLREAVGGEVEKALEELAQAGSDRRTTVHEVRKRCKRARGALRLVRDGLGAQYGRENARYRDIGRLLALARDARARLGAFRELRERFREDLEDGALGAVERALEEECRSAESAEALEGPLEEVEHELRAAQEAAGRLRLSGQGFPLVRTGALRSYRRGRKAMAKAYDDPRPERFHEWRKRTKYHRYHARLLRPLWEPVLGTRRDEAKELTDLLGDDHDLAELRAWAGARRSQLAAPRELELLLALIDRRRAELLTRAKPLGERLFAEKPAELGARLRRYWRAWRSPAQRMSEELAGDRDLART